MAPDKISNPKQRDNHICGYTLPDSADDGVGQAGQQCSLTASHKGNTLQNPLIVIMLTALGNYRIRGGDFLFIIINPNQYFPLEIKFCRDVKQGFEQDRGLLISLFSESKTTKQINKNFQKYLEFKTPNYSSWHMRGHCDVSLSHETKPEQTAVFLQTLLCRQRALLECCLCGLESLILPFGPQGWARGTTLACTFSRNGWNKS